MTERQRDRETKSHRDREAGGQRDREGGRKGRGQVSGEESRKRAGYRKREKGRKGQGREVSVERGSLLRATEPRASEVQEAREVSRPRREQGANSSKKDE